MVVDEDVITDGDAGQEDVEMCFGGRGTLRSIGKFTVLMAVSNSIVIHLNSDVTHEL